jgi:hypothetical protein
LIYFSRVGTEIISEIMMNLLSFIIASAYLIVAYIYASPAVLFRIICFLIFGLACIWFGGPLGSITGFRWIGNIGVSQETPGSIVRLLGWIVLIVVPVILLLA